MRLLGIHKRRIHLKNFTKLTMAPGLKKGRYTFRLGEPAHCCIACGREFTVLVSPTKALDEREDWKNLKKNHQPARSYMVKTEDIESMYFHKRPWIWACFYRASKKIGLTIDGNDVC